MTGASAGVGRATAIAFARRGWAVALLARGEARLRSAAVEVEQAGGRALVLPADVADAAFPVRRQGALMQDLRGVGCAGSRLLKRASNAP